MLISTDVLAEWVPMEGSSAKGINTYADPSSIRIDGQKVKMWTLTDSETSDTFNGKLFKSVKAHEEYDCSAIKSRVLWLTYTTGHLGGGEVVWSNNVSAVNGWEAVPLGTNTPKSSLYIYACVNMEQATTSLASPIQNTKKSQQTISIEEAKSKCTDLGFKSKTEAFGKCVLKLSN